MMCNEFPDQKISGCALITAVSRRLKERNDVCMKIKKMIALTLTMVLLLAALPLGSPAFADRTPSAWAAPEMTAANTSGLMTPSAANDFHNTLTRDEFCELVVVMVEQTLGYPLPVPPSNPFTDDVEPISIHALKAWNYGIITGITTTFFAPSQRVERQQLCAMMIRAIRGLESSLRMTFLSPGIATLPYRDAAQIRDYAIEPVKLAYTNVIMQGNEQGNFMPSSDITSQECVAVIIRSFNRIEAARTPSMTASQLLDAAYNRVHIGYAYGDNEYGVTQNLTLPTTTTGGATVAWSSSNNSVISISGSTGVVNTASAPRAVTLTATIRSGGATRTKTFDLMTSQNTGDRLLLENALNELDILYINEGDGDGIITGRIGLPTTVLGLPVTWQSSNSSVVSNAGIVAVPSGNETRSATLTATIRLGSQTRTKTFSLTVVNPSYSRGVTLQGIQLGMTQAQVAQVLGSARRSITGGSSETWLVYSNSNYSNFVTVAFISDRAVAIYSMANGVANQLRNRSGTVISVSEANSTGGVSALSYVDPGSSSQQYAIMIYDSASVIGTSRSLNAEGQEQLLFELVNAFRQRNSRTAVGWAPRLGSAARSYSTNRGTGNLQQLVTATGYDSARYTGGSIIPGNGDAFDALNQIVSNATGSTSMRTAILQNGITLFGAGFSGGNSGTYNTYFTYTLGTVNVITGATATQNNAVVSTVNVSPGTNNAVTITLNISPTAFNESITIGSSATGVMTATNYSATNRTVVITGVANGNANITVTGNCSGKSFTIPVSVGSVYANNLTLTYTLPGTTTATTLSTSTNVAANAAPAVTGSKTLVMAVGETIRIPATTTNGATVEWNRPNGSAGGTATATVTRNSSSNEGVISATAAGTIVLTARVRTGANNNAYITHTINVVVVTVNPIVITPTTNPQTVGVGGDIDTSVTIPNLPTTGTSPTPVYAWSPSNSNLTNISATQGQLTARYRGLARGDTTITFTATWSGSSSYLGRITRTAAVRVEGSEYATNIAVSRSSVTLIPGQEFTIIASTVPASVTQPYSFSWRPSDLGVASVTPGGTHYSEGKITAVTITPDSTDVIVDLTQGNPVNPSYTYTTIVTVNVIAFPTITIDNPGVIIAGSVTDFTYTLHGLPDTITGSVLPGVYSIRWSYLPDPMNGHFITESGQFSAGTVGTGTITVELYYGGSPTGNFNTFHVDVQPSGG